MHLTILTGAGISAESGLGTFRFKDGIWARYNLAKVATPSAFRDDPAMVQNFYNLRRHACLNAAPHAGHLALARLQREWSGTFNLITQNVDDLHERAGSEGVLHMHGELLQARCNDCARTWPAPCKMYATDICPYCHHAATRPDVVWFGEEPYHMREIYDIAATSDIFVVIGSSGQVYPAAGLAEVAARHGAILHEINLEPTDEIFTKGTYGKASEVLPDWVERLLRDSTAL